MKLQTDEARLKFEGPSGYLRSVLSALDIPIESQIAVFSKTSLQARIIGPKNPRTIFFNDKVAVGWVPGEPFVEVASHDPHQAVIFYTLDQRPTEQPRFVRRDSCLNCHISYASLGIPGMMVRSVYPGLTGQPERMLGDYVSDHSRPFTERWGGWFVTGNTGSLVHVGNMVYPDSTNAEVREHLEPAFRAGVYLAPYSDIVALMVFDHQMQMIDLLTRFSWQIRIASYKKESLDVEAAAREIVDYMLFVNEASLTSAIEGTSGFAEKFQAMGPRDQKGRSLRDLDLKHRLMRYPCSYMIYSEAFDGLPEKGRDAIYRLLWQILSGKTRDAEYSVLSASDREAVLSILRETKKGLPDYFHLAASKKFNH